jgi:CRISPR/Cas system-associated exonuclease Cas4 (RecB family)
MVRDDDRVIRASEIGQYVYCARAWWLGRVLGYRSQNVEEMAAGAEEHASHGKQVVIYHRWRGLAYLLLSLAAVVGLLLFWSLVRGG